MSHDKNSLIEKLETISDLWDKGVGIKTKMDSFVPEDNYERKIIVPNFPEMTKSDTENCRLINFDHTSEDAVETIRNLHKVSFAPKEPQKPKIKDFKAPDEPLEEKNKLSIYRCVKIVGIAVAIFFALGFFITLFDKDNAQTLPVIIILSLIGVAAYFFSKYQIKKITDAQKVRTNDALSAYNQQKDKVMASYNEEMKEFKESTKSYEAELDDFMQEYDAWRKVYLEHISEEADIAQKLERDRIAAIEKIKREEFTPILNKLIDVNDIIPDNYVPNVSIIADLIKNGRADSVKEAINLYEEIAYRERQLQLQREQEAQRQREEELRREAEERHHYEEMQFLKNQESQRRLEEEQRRQDSERRHREEMAQRDQQERTRQYEERRQKEAEVRRANKVEANRKHEEHIAMQRQCNTCANVVNCSMAFKRPNCASYRPR